MTKNLDLDFLHEIPKQGSEAWLKERLGRFTSSEFHKLLVKGKGEVFGKTAVSYILEKVAERLTNTCVGFEGNKYTEWGSEHEAEAVSVYEQRQGVKVDVAPFIPLGTNAGGSPDGFVGSDGIIEVKCPFNQVNHLKYFLENAQIPKEYAIQIQGNLMATGRKWCDFISYDPRMHEVKTHQMFIQRVERDEEIIKQIRERIDLAEIEVLKIIENGRS